MDDKVILSGKIVFDPIDYTNKHKYQSSWKKIAMVMFDGDICEYYAWFVKKRYGITLNPPLRGPHISFINDHVKDLNGGFYDSTKSGSEKLRHQMWEQLKMKYHNTKVSIAISTEVQTNGEHIWLRINHEDREALYNIRNEIGLPKPNLGKDKDGALIPLGIHLTIGYPVNGRVDEETFINGVMKFGRMNLDQTEYIHNINKDGVNEANINRIQYLIDNGVLKHQNGLFV